MISNQEQYTIAYRSFTSFTLKGPISASQLINKPDGAAQSKYEHEWKDSFRTMVFSPSGELIAFVTNENVVVLNADSRDVVYQYPQKNVVEVSFSPSGSFLSTWQRPGTPDPITKIVQNNLHIHHVPTQSVWMECVQKFQTDWMPQWTQDEQMFALLSSPDQIHFFSSKEPRKLVSRLKAENLKSFSLSGGQHPHVAVFIAEGEKNCVPAIAKLFSLKNLLMPLSSKTFFKTDRAKFLWNRSGTGVLVLTSTDVDATGQSYYGQNSLYYMSTMGNFDCRVPLEGPIHDVCWAPNFQDFAVTYGFMPSKTVLFSHRANPIFDFGTASRNTLSFSPNGRILCIGGFGNLPGELDFWDLVDMKKLVTVSCPNSTYLEWSPDGRYLLTATLSPRLRVDNGWKIWHYRGACIAQSKVSVLLQIGWRPSSTIKMDLNAWKLRALSPAPKSIISVAPAATSGVYVPPSARLRASANTSQGTSPATSQVVGATLLHGSTKKRGEPQITSEGNYKKISDLKKKLKQIQVLKKKRDNGETLDSAQLLKINRESALRQELSDLTDSNHHHK